MASLLSTVILFWKLLWLLKNKQKVVNIFYTTSPPTPGQNSAINFASYFS